MQNYTDQVTNALEGALKEAQQRKNTEVTENHLLHSFLKDKEGYFYTVLSNLGTKPQALIAQVTEDLNRQATFTGSGSAPKPGKTLQKQISGAESTAKAWKDPYVNSDHFFISYWKDGGSTFNSWKKEYQLSLEDVEKALHHAKEKQTQKTAPQEGGALATYCKNLTQLAKEGKLDPVIGRDEEIRRTIQVLCRRTKNNPMLIGEPGVGKTAIAEGLAQRIIQEDVPESMKKTQLLTLEMGSLIAGTKMRGEFEERLKSILDEIQERGREIILFIDEIHTLVGAGATDGAMDAANLLKPALARGMLSCIGATTLSEYQKHIEKDQALERRFLKVVVGEPSLEDAIAILRGLREKYEIFHGVRIDEAAIHSAVHLSHRYISERFLPDKAIDLIDEAASLIRMQIGSRPLPIDTKERALTSLIVELEAMRREDSDASKKAKGALEAKIADAKEELATLKQQWEQEKKVIETLKEKKNSLEQLRFQEEQAERDADFNRLAELRYNDIPNMEKELEEAEAQISSKEHRLLREEVDQDLIAHIVSKWTGIPVEKMLKEEAERLLHLEDELHKRVIGQDIAVQAVSEAIRRSRSGLSDPNRPVGAFLFAGPTGVGKTELAKALAKLLFDREDAIVRLDMSEYMEKHSVARLIGSPPGYVGFDEGGQLTEALRRRPYSVVLLDEVEKAHPDVFNLLLQIFDDGRITDSKGRTVNCKHSLFIMTSNLGSEQLLESEAKTKEEVLALVEPPIRAHFRPEFLNRLDEILPFLPLQKEDMKQMVELQLQQLAKRIRERDIELVWDDEVMVLLAAAGYDPRFGARPLKRLIQQTVVNMLAEGSLAGKIQSGQRVRLECEESEIVAKVEAEAES